MPKKDERKRSEARKADVDRDMLRLRGLTRKDLEKDVERGSLSPLGAGSYSVRKGQRK